MQKILSQPGLPREIPLSILLGLTDPEGVEWGRIRALQFNGIHQHSFLKIVSAIVCGLLTMQWGAGLINGLYLGLWLTALCALYVYSHILYRKQSTWQRRSIDRGETAVQHPVYLLVQRGDGLRLAA